MLLCGYIHYEDFKALANKITQECHWQRSLETWEPLFHVWTHPKICLWTYYSEAATFRRFLFPSCVVLDVCNLT